MAWLVWSFSQILVTTGHKSRKGKLRILVRNNRHLTLRTNHTKRCADGPARQPSSVQRGSVAYINQYPGDPTTPGYASKSGVERVNNPPNLPKIPSLPISHRDALPLLKALNDHGLSGRGLERGGWVGGLNASYDTGPSPGVTLSLTNFMEEKTTPIWNVIGVINGTNSNETIIIGNHRDAWIIGGAADPNSGSAILVEMTKAFGELLKTGWKPLRNMYVLLIFCLFNMTQAKLSVFSPPGTPKNMPSSALRSGLKTMRHGSAIQRSATSTSTSPSLALFRELVPHPSCVPSLKTS